MCRFKQVRCHGVAFVGVKRGSLERESYGVGVRTHSQGAGEMAHSVKFLTHKHEDLSSDLQDPCHKRRSYAWQLVYNFSTSMTENVDPWSLLASQPSQEGGFQAQ